MTDAVGPSVRVRVGIGAAVVLVVVALVCSVLVTAFSPVGSTTVFGGAATAAPGVGHSGSPLSSDGSSAASGTAAPDPSSGGGGSAGAGSRSGGGGAGSGAASGAGGAADAGGTSATILVHVLGAVASPGVYELPEASRVIDAVAAAGGLAGTADQASVNLARVLVDGEQLRILAIGEVPPPPVAGAGAASGAGAGGPGSSSAGGSAGSGAGASGGAPPVINLNAATELDLDGLPRIGPAMAARIITWRTDNGPFTSVDDLLQIPGIGDKTLESLRPLVTV